MIAKGVAYLCPLEMLTTAGAADTGAGALTVVVSKDGADDAPATNAAVQVAGTHVWTVQLTLTEMNADLVSVVASRAGDVPCTRHIQTENVYTSEKAAFLDDAVSDAVAAGAAAEAAVNGLDLSNLDAAVSDAIAAGAAAEAAVNGLDLSNLDAPISNIPTTEPATPTDVSNAQTAIIEALPDVSGLATQESVNAIPTTDPATPTDVSNAQTAIIEALPAAPDNAGITNILNALVAIAGDGWTDQTLVALKTAIEAVPTAEAVAQAVYDNPPPVALTEENIESIAEGVTEGVSGSIPSVGDIAAGVWNYLKSLMTTANSIGKAFKEFLEGTVVVSSPLNQPGTQNYTLVRDKAYALEVDISPLSEDYAGYLLSIRDKRSPYTHYLTQAIEPEGTVFLLEFTSPETGLYRYDVTPLDDEGNQLPPILAGDMTVQETATYAGNVAE